MTSPNGAVPDKAYVSGGSGQSGLSDLNDLTEGVAKQRMRNATAPSFNAHRDGVWGAFGDLADAFLGRYTGNKGPMVRINDGMTALNNRLDLMSEVSGYGGMVMSKSVRMKVNDYRRVPFDLQYGPPKNTTVDTVNNRIYLAKGTWSISWIIAMQQSDLGNTEIWNRPRIDVFAPDGSLYTRRWLDHASMRYPDAAFFQTIVVTPDAGYYTEAWFTADAFRVLYGGTDRSVFWANRWDINSDNAPSVVDPPVVDVT